MDQLTPYTHRPSARPLAAAVKPSFRVGEVERAAACDALAEHFGAGRLDPAELDDRLARAMAARSSADLRVLFVDLGPRRTVAGTVPAPAAPAGRPGSGALVPVLACVMVVSLLLAGAMLVALGLYDFALFLAALVGGSATAVAGGCATVLGRGALRRP